jgi:hypothetical protein
LCTTSADCTNMTNAICMPVTQTEKYCISCPTGYKANNNTCMPCEKGWICDDLGNVKCPGSCPLPYMPICQAPGLPVVCVQDACKTLPDIYTKANYINDNFMTNSIFTESFVHAQCIPRFNCLPGYYVSQFTDKINNIWPWNSIYNGMAIQMKCLPCTNTNNYIPLSPGLTMFDAESCVWDQYNKTFYNNRAGYYYDPTNIFNFCLDNGRFVLCMKSRSCPRDLTSYPLRARSVVDCSICPILPVYNPIIYTTPSTCEWTCSNILTHVMVGDTCIDTTDTSWCINKQGMRFDVFGLCTTRFFPWQKAGNSPLDSYMHSDSYAEATILPGGGLAEGINYIVSFARAPLVENDKGWLYKSDTIAVKNYLYYDAQKSYSLHYLLVQMNSNVVYNLKVHAKTCSIAWDHANNILFFVYCDIPIILFTQYDGNSFSSIQRVSGNYTTGYKEGMQYEALFGKELYIAYVQNINRIYVVDTYNNMLRLIAPSPDGWADFRTKSYKVYGAPTENLLLLPRYLFPMQSVYSPEYISFQHDLDNKHYLCYLYVPQNIVQCLNDIVIDDYILGIYVSSDNAELILQYSNYNHSITRLSTPCPDDYTSLQGGDCSIYKPWNNGQGHYIQNGIAYPCITTTCAAGSVYIPCNRTRPSYCEECVTPVTSAFQWTVADSCEYKLVPPCPINMYHDIQTGSCERCPVLMTTVSTNNTGITSCTCPIPLVPDISHSSCIIPSSMISLYPILMPNSCNNIFQHYSDFHRKCISCAQEKCVFAPVGYKNSPLSCLIFEACPTVPQHAIFFVTKDPTNPTFWGTCYLTCESGYTLVNNVCISSSN